MTLADELHTIADDLERDAMTYLCADKLRSIADKLAAMESIHLDDLLQRHGEWHTKDCCCDVYDFLDAARAELGK